MQRPVANVPTARPKPPVNESDPRVKRTRKLLQEIFVDMAQHVFGPGCGGAETDVADEVDQLTEPLLVQSRT